MSDNPWNESSEGSALKPASAQPGKEWGLLEKALLSATQEQKRARRWGIFFKLLTFAYIAVVLVMFSTSMSVNQVPGGGGDSGSHTALVEVKGVIAEDEVAGADVVVRGLRRAFENDGTKGVVLRINSPGGSAVQSGMIYDEIKRLREQHPDVKVYAAIGDLGASGGYYIAAAADEIYANKSSLVGSIGVISSSFGFVDAMDKLGVERRLYTAGENKAFLDAFSPSKDEEVAFWESVLSVTHQQFIDAVKAGRGDRLQDNEKVFSGFIWNGEQALELGLIDGLGSAGYIARELIGEENVVNFTPRKNPFEELVEQLGVAFGRTIATQAGFGGGIQLR